MTRTLLEPDFIASNFIAVSLEDVFGSNQDKVKSIAQKLLVNEASILRQPIKNDSWSKIKRFFSHLFRSREVCQYKDLKENLLCIQKLFAHSQSLSVSITPKQYEVLLSLYKGNSKDALVDLTKRLEEAVSGSYNEKELQKIIQNIQHAVPNEVLPCPIKERERFLEVRAILKQLSSEESVSQSVKDRIVQLKGECSTNVAIALDLERASVLVEKLEQMTRFRNKNYSKEEIATSFCDVEALLVRFEELVQKTTLGNEQKDCLLQEYKEAAIVLLEGKIDAVLLELEKEFCQRIKNAATMTEFEVASKEVWQVVNGLGNQLKELDNSSLEHARDHLQNRLKEVCSTIAESFQAEPIISELNRSVTNQYQALLQQIEIGGMTQEQLKEKAADILELKNVIRHPIQVAHYLKNPVGSSRFEHLNLLLQTNRDILLLLENVEQAIDKSLKAMEEASRTVAPLPVEDTSGRSEVEVISVPIKQVVVENRTYTQHPTKLKQLQALAKAEGVKASVIKGAGASALFAALGVVAGLSAPMAAVLGLGTVAACTMGSNLDTADKNVTLLSGMATMGLLAYFGTTMVSQQIVPLDVAEAAIGQAVNTTVDAVLPTIVAQAANSTIPSVLTSFANQTVPVVVDALVKESVTDVCEGVIGVVVENATRAVIENSTASVVSQVIQEAVPTVVNNTVEALVPEIVLTTTESVVSAVTASTVETVAADVTPDFISFIYQQCASANLSQEACIAFTEKTLTPALQEKLFAVLTPELLLQLHNELTPALVLQLKEQLGPALSAELLTSLSPALQEGLLAAFIPQLSQELVESLPSELIVALTDKLTPAFIEQFSVKLTPDMTKQLVAALTPELQEQLKQKLAPEIFEKLLPLFTKMEHIRWMHKAQGVGFVVLGAAGIALAPVSAPLIAIGGAFGAAAGVAKIFGWV